jgi:hypothetical protein
MVDAVFVKLSYLYSSRLMPIVVQNKSLIYSNKDTISKN